MKIKLATSCFVISTLLTAMTAHAADPNAAPAHPKILVNDSVITSEIKAKLADDKISNLAQIVVDTRANGEVLLSGKVTTQEEADQAISIARETEGVTSVRSELKKND